MSVRDEGVMFALNFSMIFSMFSDWQNELFQTFLNEF
jgi:hypothetical protein